MITNLSVYKVLFVLEIFLAEFLFMFRLRKRSYYPLRLAGSLSVSVAAAFALPAIPNAIYSSFMFFGIFAVTIVTLKFCYKESWLNILFCGIAAYTTQHFAYEFTNFVTSLALWGRSPLMDLYSTNEIDLSSFGKETIFWVALYIVCYFTVYAAVYFVFCKRIKKDEDLKIKNGLLFMLITVGLFVNIILNSVLVYRSGEQEVVTSLILCVYNCFCCLLLLFVQFALVHSKNLQAELDTVKKLLDKEKEQYAVLNGNINLVNIKCHDIKHQIRKIGEGRRFSESAIKEIEDTVSIYDSIVKTGNEALDTIFTEKNFLCVENNIILTCMADTSCLNFMSDSDIYSLFGNALDNAIEAVSKISELEKRVVSIKVSGVKDFVTVAVQNYFEGEIKFGSDGYPVTARSSPEHGFGMKSIAYIVEKYGGIITVKAEKGVFRLNILFSVKK